MEQPAGKGVSLIILGAAIGAALMALTTPKRGQEVRAKIKDTVRRTRTKVDNGVDHLESDLEEAMETARNKFGSTKLVEEKIHDR